MSFEPFVMTVEPAFSAVRAASVRWRRLSALLGQIERCVAANARLDAARTAPSARGRPLGLGPTYVSLEARMARVTAQLGEEVSRLTQERLQVELERRRQREKAS